MKTLAKEKKNKRRVRKGTQRFISTVFFPLRNFAFFALKFFFITLLILSCSKKDKINNQIEEQFIMPDPIWVKAQEIAAGMDDSLLAAQVLITGIDGRGKLLTYMRTLLEEIPAGGIMLFRQNVDTDNDSIRNLINEASSIITENSGAPPFVAVDLEGGTVNRFSRNKTELPYASSLPEANSYWELAQEQGKSVALYRIENDAFKAGTEIAALGINMNFAPVVETLNKDNYDFLKSRSYGIDPDFTTLASLAFIRGMKNAGVLCVLKHFPGSAGVDPHYAESVVNISKNDFYDYVSPFKNTINNSAVMIAHTLVSSIDKENIASLSTVFMKDILRDEWNFNGIIIADDFTMKAAGNIRPEQAAVLSLANGADMILVWSSDLRRTHAEFLKALQDGRLEHKRLKEAATRVIYQRILTKSSQSNVRG